NLATRGTHSAEPDRCRTIGLSDSQAAAFEESGLGERIGRIVKTRSLLSEPAADRSLPSRHSATDRDDCARLLGARATFCSAIDPGETPTRSSSIGTRSRYVA